ncbi:MAG: restriction endonuclease subunit S [Faecalibacterium sp.]|jgi:type I restriction enzyme S subunit
MREMKDSGIEWIGDIPVSWKIMPNKYLMRKEKKICPVYHGEDILSLTMKGVIVRDLDAGGKMPTSFDGYQRLEAGNLLMCLFDIDVTPRCVGLIKQAGVSSPAYSQFVLRKGADAAYYCYYYTMLDNDKTLLHLAKNLRHSLTEDQLGAIPVIVPPIEEQQRIADFLDTKCAEIDALTADIQTQIDTLEQYKRSVITETVTKGLNPDVEITDSGVEWVGEIPAHWLVHPVYYYYGERKNKNYLGKEDNLLSLSYGRVVRKDINTSDGLLPESFNTYNIVETGDIIIRPTDLQNDKRSLRTGLVKEHGIITSAYIDLCPIKQVDSRYFYFLLHAYDVMKVFYNMGNGVRQGLNYSEFSRLMVFEPPYEEQVAIADYLETKVIEVDAIIERKKEQMSVLNAYKRSLIFEYVTGKKEVRNETADAIVALNPHIILLGIINDRIGKKHTRGKVQLQKLLYLLDIHVGMNVNTKYYRYEHGPYDRQLNCYIDVLIKNRWYEQRHDNGEILIKGKNHDEFVRKYKNQFREKQMEINQLIDALRDMKTSQLERIATLYAVWNDFILEGENHPTDEKILHEVVTNWTANKANPQDGTWKLSLEKMKKLGIIPTGKGLHTSRKPMRKAENE